jgi:hypothetical protein
VILKNRINLKANHHLLDIKPNRPKLDKTWKWWTISTPIRRSTITTSSITIHMRALSNTNNFITSNRQIIT